MEARRSLAIVINSSAGSAGDDDLHEQLRTHFPHAELIDSGDDLMGALSKAATFDILGVVGGDGTINAAASVALDANTPLAAIPGGTLNHFARDLRLESMEATAAAIEAGRTEHIDVGLIDGEVFLNTASFGSYPELVDEREEREASMGKWPAMAVAMFKIMRGMTPSDVAIDGVRTKVWLFFAGNCQYDPPGLAPMSREHLDDGLLDLRWIDASVRFSRTRTFFAMLTGPRGWTYAVKRVVADSVEITSHEGSLRLARDGETFDGGSHVTLAKRPKALEVFVGESN